MMRRPPRSTLFPYTTLFRSINAVGAVLLLVAARELSNHGGRLASYNDVTIYLRVPTGPLAQIMAVLALVGAPLVPGHALLLVTARQRTEEARGGEEGRCRWVARP